MMRSRGIIVLVLILCILATWLLGHLYKELLSVYEQAGSLTDSEYSWIFRLLLNLIGYSTVLLPCYVLYKYLEKINYFDKITNNTWLSRILFACFSDHERIPDNVKPAKLEEGSKRETLEFFFCLTGLMGAYLVWGLLQEKIMTQNYVMSDGSQVRFSDSQFLVFINRLLGFSIALARLVSTRQTLLAAPLYKFSYCSLTNIISAWCQYEALKYVSFPTQVLSKSCKVIPVMIMGKLVSRATYERYEYVTAALISAGMVLFMAGAGAGGAGAGASSAGAGGALGGAALSGASGACLLALYLCCDGFTASWQGALFRRYSLRPLQMLCAVNLCSCALTAAALLYRPPHSLPLLTHPTFLMDAALLSASSALGQLLIYRTIARFGPVVFTFIMTLRQAVSILISCVVYGHAVSAAGVLGVLLVFTAVFLRVYCRRRKHAAPAAPPALTAQRA